MTSSLTGQPGTAHRSETLGTIEIGQSPFKMLGLAALSLVMVGASAFAVFGLPGQDRGSLLAFIGIVGMLFFGLCGVAIAWRALAVRGPVVTLSPQGLHDVRVSRLPIPWTAVRTLHTWSFRGQKILVVGVDPETEQDIELTRIARWTRGPNQSLGADGLSVTAQGLKITYEQLLDLVRAYASTYAAAATSQEDRGQQAP